MGEELRGLGGKMKHFDQENQTQPKFVSRKTKTRTTQHRKCLEQPSSHHQRKIHILTTRGQRKGQLKPQDKSPSVGCFGFLLLTSSPGTLKENSPLFDDVTSAPFGKERGD